MDGFVDLRQVRSPSAEVEESKTFETRLDPPFVLDEFVEGLLAGTRNLIQIRICLESGYAVICIPGTQISDGIFRRNAILSIISRADDLIGRLGKGQAHVCPTNEEFGMRLSVGVVKARRKSIS